MILPRRWKIFRLLNYLQIGCAAAFAAEMLYIFWDDPYNTPNLFETIIVALPFMIFPAVMITYACINLRLVGRCYPDRMPGVTLATLLDLVPVAAGLVIAAHGVAAFLLFNEVFHSTKTSTSSHLAAGYFILVFITGVWAISQQVTLQNTISRNYALKNSQPDSDPQPS